MPSYRSPRAEQYELRRPGIRADGERQQLFEHGNDQLERHRANHNHVSANQLTATIAASNIATPATVAITVTNPGTAGTGIYNTGATLAETSAAMNFTVELR